MIYELQKPFGAPEPTQKLVMVQYDAHELQEIWDDLAPFFQRSIDKSQGMLTLEVLTRMLANGDAVCFATKREAKIEAVLAIRICDYATYKSARILAIAGRCLKDAEQFLPALESWALTQGAIELEGWCRPSMTRLTERLGWTVKVSMVTRDLRRKLQ